MFRQSPTSYKVVFAKRRQIIFVIFYQYKVLKNDAQLLVLSFCHFCQNIKVLRYKIKLFLKAKRDPASRALQTTEISLYNAFTNEWNVAKVGKMVEEWLILLK